MEEQEVKRWRREREGKGRQRGGEGGRLMRRESGEKLKKRRRK